MAKFVFELQRVLELREQQEQDAQQVLRQARAARSAAEEDKVRTQAKRTRAASTVCASFEERMNLTNYLERLEDEIMGLEAGLVVLRNEEDQALEKWRVAKQDLQAFEELRDRAYREWMLEQLRLEQLELDEWTVQTHRLRKAA